MVKGVSRQVLVLHCPEEKLFEEAIFILKEEALRGGGISNDDLLKEAKKLIGQQNASKKRGLLAYGPVWAFAGSLLTAAVWGMCLLF